MIEDPENYAPWTVALYREQHALGWNLRDKKYHEARKNLVEIMRCASRISEYVNAKDKQT